MNKLIPKIGAAIVTITVFLFAVFLIVDFPFGYYLVCMFLPIGYIIMAAGDHNRKTGKFKRAGSKAIGLRARRSVV